MRTYKTPGVYVEEIATLPPTVVPVSTAIPAFIGYTEKRPGITVEAFRISSFAEYRLFFGGPFLETAITVEVEKDNTGNALIIKTPPVGPARPTYWLYYQLQMYFANGGGPCYIVSIDTYKTSVDANLFASGFEALKKEDEPTLILAPDLIGTLPLPLTAPSVTKYYGFYQTALNQCADLKDRFTLIDPHGSVDLSLPEGINIIRDLRIGIGANNLHYGAAYFPWLETTLGYAYDESKVKITSAAGVLSAPAETVLKYNTSDLAALPAVMDNSTPPKPVSDALKQTFYETRSLFHIDNAAYTRVRTAIDSIPVNLPPSGAMAGVYARVDNSRGVFKAPANVSLNNVVRPVVKVNNDQQADLNVHTSGKSINVIRSFSDKGVMVWGARTLDGNSNEWRYIPVRRLFIFAEESISKTLERFVFEPNNENTWVAVKAAIENFLTDQWKAGALAGNSPKQAFFVQVGLGQTMTAQDILEGRLIVTVGMAAVRPAEFIVLQFTHKLQEA